VTNGGGGGGGGGGVARGDDIITFNRIVTELQEWRDEDHEDTKVMTRNDIIEILEGIYTLRRLERMTTWTDD
jgi:hypothetical protein